MCLALTVFRCSGKANSRVVIKEDYMCQPLGAEHRDQRKHRDRKEASEGQAEARTVPATPCLVMRRSHNIDIDLTG